MSKSLSSLRKPMPADWLWDARTVEQITASNSWPQQWLQRWNKERIGTRRNWAEFDGCHMFWGKHSCYYVRRMLKARISDRRVTPQFRPWYASTVATFTGNWSLSFAFQINWSMKFFWALYGVMMPCRSTRVLRLRTDRIDSPPLQGGSELGCAPSSHLNLNNAGRKRCWDVCFAKNLRVCIFYHFGYFGVSWCTHVHLLQVVIPRKSVPRGQCFLPPPLAPAF